MPQITRSGLRARLLFFALLVFLPALGLIFYGALEERQRAAQAAQTEALRLARLASLEQAQVFEGARQLLLGLAQSPAVLRRDGSRCNALFSAVLAQFQGYTNISAATPDGAVFCSAVPLTAPVNFGDRPYFQQALKTRRFAVSSYVIGRITGKPNVAVAQVAVDGAGAVQAVVVAGLDTSWLNHLAADAQLPRGSALTVIDSKGVVLTRYPAWEQWTGKAVPEAPVAKAVRAGEREGTLTGPGLDGVERLYTFTRLPTPPESGDVYISIGIPRAVVFAGANRTLTRNLVALVLVTLLATAAAWIGAGRLVLRQTSTLVEATRRLEAGDLSARTGQSYAGGELGGLARAFDRMAAALEKRTAQLAEAEARYRALVDQSLAGIYLIVGERIVYMNQAGAEIFGYRQDEVVGRLRPTDLVHPDDRPLVAEKVRARLQGQLEFVRYTFRGVRKDATVIHCEVFGRQITYGGEPAVLGTLIDITERVRAEKELRRLNRALRTLSECNQRLVRATDQETLLNTICRLLVDVGGYRTAWVGLAEQDEDKTVRPAAQAGYSDGYLETVRVSWADTEWGRGPAGLAIRTGRVSIARDIQTETGFEPWRTEAVRRGYASVIGLPLSSPEGQPFGALVIFASERDAFDVEEVDLLSELAEDLAYGVVALRTRLEREQAQAEVERQRQARYQSEKLADMGTLLAGVAHELNNPLSVVSGYAALLRQAAGEGPLAERAQKILTAAERCARIIRNFLALARQHPPERRQARLNQIVREAVELLAYPLRVDDVEVRLDLAQDLPPLWADPHQLHQVVVNFITNAHQAMHGSPPPRQLSITTYHDAARALVRLQVADTGPGIPPEIRDQIFEPFFTTKPLGQGTGLGLSLCKGIVDGHGGTIRVDSQPGHGAIFTVELPVLPAPGEEQRASPAELQALPGGKRILVVDDEPDVAGVLVDLLGPDGHQVETAPNGLAALQMLQQGPYDLIISDVRMPQLDGLGLYKELERRHPELLRRFLFLTGDTLNLEAKEFIERTGKPGLSKPFDFDEVRRTVRRALLDS